VPEPFSSSQLIDLYKIAIEEYRYQVRLNWDRTAYYLTLNSGLVAIATGLLKLSSAPLVNLFVAAVFLLGLVASLIGIKNLKTGHEYYRRTVIKETLLEDQLGLTKPSEDYPTGLTFAVGTTVGQGEHLQILHDTDKWLKRPLRGSITFWIVKILTLFCVFNAGGIAGSLWLYSHPPVVREPPPEIRLVPVKYNHVQPRNQAPRNDATERHQKPTLPLPSHRPAPP
jgi:hypothetical protein